MSPPADLVPSLPVHIRDTLTVPVSPHFSANIPWEPWDVYYEQDKPLGGIYHALAHQTPLRYAFPEYRLRDGKVFYKSYCFVPAVRQTLVIQAWHIDSAHAGAAALQAHPKSPFGIEGLADKCKPVLRHCPVSQAAHAPQLGQTPRSLAGQMSLTNSILGPEAKTCIYGTFGVDITRFEIVCQTPSPWPRTKHVMVQAWPGRAGG